MSQRLQRSVVITILWLFSLLLPFSLFSQPKLKSIAELTQSAEIVAVGRVSSLVSEWNENRSMIRTRVTLLVDEFMKGGSGSRTLTLYVPGGEVGTVGEVYSDMAAFKPNEEVVVFAERDLQNRYRVSSGPQGKVTIHREKITGAPMIAPGKTLESLTTNVKQAVESQIDKQ